MRLEQHLARTTLCVHETQLDRLRDLSQTTGAPVSWLVRTAIAEYLARHPIASSAGQAPSGLAGSDR